MGNDIWCKANGIDYTTIKDLNAESKEKSMSMSHILYRDYNTDEALLVVKEINDKYYKIYSEGDPELIKTICKNDTIPENYDEIIAKNKEEGNEIMSLCGKKVKMNYLQCQKIERNKCESNMIFLGFVFYREIKGGYNPGYS